MVTPKKSVRVPTQGSALFDYRPQFFESSGIPRRARNELFSFWGDGDDELRVNAGYDYDQVTTRAEGTPPLYVSSFDNAEEWAREFLAGCGAMGFNPTPQQWKIADALNAHGKNGRPLYSTMGVCVPRRAGKTTVLLALAIGRCLTRPGYSVLFTAQSGTKASARFLEMARTLERQNPNDVMRGFRIMRGAGNQNLTFANGSIFQVLPPKPDAFRGDSGDLIILDEAQEHTADMSAELIGAILPTMDTRPGAVLVVAGTAGERRSGLFWDTLVEGRAGVNGVGIIEFAAPDTTTPEEAADPETWIASHPGIGTLTDVDTIAQRFERLPFPQFAREYLGIWPEDYSQSAIDPQLWRDAISDEQPKPDMFAFAYDVAPDGSSAAIAAAWRVDGIAYLEIVDHRLGTTWLVPRLCELAKRYRAIIGHDTIGAALAEAELLGRKRPKPRTYPATMRDVTNGCFTFMRELASGNLKHFDQIPLSEAAARAAKRPLSENSWAWGRRLSGGDITPLVAATLALRTYDQLKPRTAVRIVTTKTA